MDELSLEALALIDSFKSYYKPSVEAPSIVWGELMRVGYVRISPSKTRNDAWFYMLTDQGLAFKRLTDPRWPARPIGTVRYKSRQGI